MTSFPELTAEEFEKALPEYLDKHAKMSLEISNDFLRLYGGDVKKSTEALAAHGLGVLCGLIDAARKPGLPGDDVKTTRIAAGIMDKVASNMLAGAVAKKMGFDPDNTSVILV